MFPGEPFLVITFGFSNVEVAFKVKYVDVKGTEKNIDIKAPEGEKLLDSIKMAGIPIRCRIYR